MKKSKNEYSILNLYSQKPIIRLLKPHSWFVGIKSFFKRKKYIKERAREGFCSSDLWDYDEYLVNLIVESLKSFIEKNQGYPDSNYGSIGDFHEAIKDVIKCLEIYIHPRKNPVDIKSDNVCLDIELGEKPVTIKAPEKDKEAWHQYCEEEEVIRKERLAALKEGFEKLNKILPEIWF